ncbi:MAG: TfoX/Sxy family protein [Polyangiaceae bacterium]
MTPKELSAKLEAAAAALSGVERKRMPGGYALFASGKIFANVTLDGRIGLKLPVAWCFEDLAGRPGAGPWKLGQRLMEGWVLVPESFHESDALLLEWVTRSYECVLGRVPADKPAPPSVDVEESPPTARSKAADSVDPRTQPSPSRVMMPPPRQGTPAVIIDEVPKPALPVRPPRSSKSLVPAPPSSRNGFDFSSYAPPPPSSVGIRVVPRHSKSVYEETLIGVPAPSSTEIENPESDEAAGEASDASAPAPKG